MNSPELVVKVQTWLGIKYPEVDESTAGITVRNLFLYYLFVIGTELGDETFYACFIPCWFWNVDGAVGRRFVFVWALLMYIGQALKDVLRCPRPPKPVIKLQEKWAAEYGLPSTHAMVRRKLICKKLCINLIPLYSRWQYLSPSLFSYTRGTGKSPMSSPKSI